MTLQRSAASDACGKKRQEEQEPTDQSKPDRSNTKPDAQSSYRGQTLMNQQAWLTEIVGYDTGWNVQAAAATAEDATLTAELRHPETGQLVPILLSRELFPSPDSRRAEVLRQIAEKEQAS
jgi:hypothetical protein